MDVNKLRTLVFEKTGIKVDTNDPIFALVALNEVVLAECVEQHVAVMLDATDNLGAQTMQLMEAGERYKNLLQQMAAVAGTGAAPELAAVLAKESTPAEASQKKPAASELNLSHWLAGAAGVALLSSLLTLGGIWAFAGPGAAPQARPSAAMPAAPPLTAEQTQLIQNGEKYAKMLPKLDAATRAKIQQLVQQP